jgi:hypothetical protein
MRRIPDVIDNQQTILVFQLAAEFDDRIFLVNKWRTLARQGGI